MSVYLYFYSTQQTSIILLTSTAFSLSLFAKLGIKPTDLHMLNYSTTDLYPWPWCF